VLVGYCAVRTQVCEKTDVDISRGNEVINSSTDEATEAQKLSPEKKNAKFG